MDIAGIVNLALQRLGTRTSVSAAELAAASSNEAIQANLAIAQTRDELLRLAPWQCAKGVAQLQYITSLNGTPENQAQVPSQLSWVGGLPLPPWIYEYAYPTDCLRALSIVTAFNTGFGAPPIYPAATSVGFSSGFNGPPVKFDVGNDILFAATSAAIVSGGTGYAVGDLITLALGPITSMPIGNPAILQVTAVAGGVITGVVPYSTIYGEDAPQSGGYFAALLATQAQGSTTGAGTGATFNLTYASAAGQRVILTNQEYAVLRYIRRVVDPNVMDALFVRAWYNILGAAMAMSLIGDKALANNLIQIGNGYIQEARAADANEALTINDVSPDWLRVRGIIQLGDTNMGTSSVWGSADLWPGY